MLAFPQGDLLIAQYCVEPVTYFPSWPAMLAIPQGDLFIAQYCAEPVTSFPSCPVMLAFPQGDLFIAQYCTEPVTYFPSWPVMLALTRDVRWPKFVGTGTERNAFPFKKDLSLSSFFFVFSLSWNGSFHSFQSFFGLVIPFFAVLFQFFHLSTFLNPFHIFWWA